MDRFSCFDMLPEAQAISVAILDVEVAASVWLVTHIARDLDASGFEFRVQQIRIVDPDVRVPRFTRRIDHPVWPYGTGLLVLRQHDDHAASRDHTERRRLVPKPAVAET